MVLVVGGYIGLLMLAILLFIVQRGHGRRRTLLAVAPLVVLASIGAIALVLAVWFVVRVNQDCDRNPSCRNPTAIAWSSSVQAVS